MKINQLLKMTAGILSLFVFGLLFGEILKLTINRNLAGENRSRLLLAEGSEAVMNGHYMKSVDILSESIKLDSTNAKARQIRGDAYFALENYSAAFADYSESVKISPNAPAYAGLGNVFVKMNNIPESIINYTKAAELEPGCARYYFIRGQALNMQGKYDDAINDFDYALKIEPDNVEYKQNRDFALSLKKMK